MEDKKEQNGALEHLNWRVTKLIVESKDQEYTEYLQKLSERVRHQKFQTDLLETELERSYQMYLTRMKLTGIEIVEKQEPVEETSLTNEQNVVEVQESLEIQKEAQANSNKVILQKEASQANTVGVQENLSQQQYFNSLDGAPPRQEPQNQQKNHQQLASQTSVQQQTQIQTTPVRQTPPKQKKSNAEFTIGATVLSVVGGGFILAALVMLGMTFMEGIVKGICLYGISLIFLLISELLLYRKWPMLGAIFSTIGIGGLYLSTIVNYLGLHNFNLWVTLGITIGITFFVVLLSRKRDSILYRMLGIIAGYLCFFTIQAGITEVEFLVVSGMILLLNVLCITVPMQRSKTGVHIAHMLMNTFFAFCFIYRAMTTCDMGELPILIFTISSMVVLLILFVTQCYSLETQNPVKIQSGFLVAYYFSAAGYLFLINTFVYKLVDMEMGNWYCYGSAIAVGTISLMAMLVLSIGKRSGQGHIYTVLNLMLLYIVGCSYGKWDYIICLLALLVVAKLIGCWRKDTVYRINDMYITAILCIVTGMYDGIQAYVLLAGVIFSILMIHYNQTYYEILLMVTLLAYTAKQLPIILQLPVIVGLLLVGILMFNNVKRWQGKYILLFNGLALGGQLLCFLSLCNPVYRNESITYLCMLIFGITTIVLTLQERYQMNFSGKYMILAVFLTYMAFLFRANVPVVNSILLMIIALVCVGIGFVANKKAVRIYGLVLSLVVCGKLVLYDFFQAATLQKTILFFAVGVISLVIATIYIVLEKKNSNSNNA